MARVKRHSTSDLMDEWLESQGYYRKHTAKDGSCLFRAVSEQVFHTQALHFEVRMACVQFMKRNRDQFEEFVEGSFDSHLCNLEDPKEWAGQVEMSAMASLFHHDFEVFHEPGKGPCKVTDNGYKNKILLYFSQGNHYDSVYSRSFIADAAVCQSTVYEILYKKVFCMGEEVDLAVEKMLHDKAYAKLRKDSTASVDSNSASPSPDFSILLDQENDLSSEEKDKEPGSEIRRALALGFPPFPYKVAKALDTEIYRNVEFDIWNEAKKDEIVFEPGMKCLVRLDKNGPEVYHAHIQEISPEKGPVTVYIVELGKKQNVSYESLEPLPLSYNKACWQTLGKSYKAVNAFYQKPSLSETIYDVDKGKKKIFKKGKFKDFSLSLPMPRGQGLPPRFQSQPSQYDTSVMPVGRGRGPLPYHGVPRSPLPHIKWVSPVNQTQSRYRQRTVSGGRYCISNVSYNSNSENFNRTFESKLSYNAPDVNQLQPSPKSSTPTTTSVTWVKSIGSVSSTAPYSSTASTENGGGSVNKSQKIAESQVNLTTTSPVGAMPVTSTSSDPVVAVTVPSPNCISQPIIVPAYTSTTSNCYSFGVPYTVSSATPMPTTPLVPTVSQSPIPSPTYITSQPIAIYPCYYAGVYVPFEPPVHPVNYSVPRSQDPSGSDLPLQDLATLRFFYNLGCDYFRIATVIPIPPNQCAMWNYGNQMPCSSVNGYFTPMTNSDACEGVEDSPTTSATCLSSADSATEVEGLPVDELYEPAYVYGSPAISFVPAVYQPLDYCTSVPGLVGEFKSGLVLNEQGILSLNTAACTASLPTITVAPRQRSDSCSSNHSQGSNHDWNLGHAKAHSCTYTSNNGISGVSDLHVGGSYKDGASGLCSQYNPRANSTNHLQSRLHKMNLSPQKQPTSPFQSQPLVQVGVAAPASSTYPLVQAAAGPLLTASPSSLGMYSSASHAGATVLTAAPATTYYGPSPPAVLVPTAHPQSLSFLPSSIQ